MTDKTIQERGNLVKEFAQLFCKHFPAAFQSVEYYVFKKVRPSRNPNRDREFLVINRNEIVLENTNLDREGLIDNMTNYLLTKGTVFQRPDVYGEFVVLLNDANYITYRA